MRKLKWIALAGLILALLLVGGLFVANWYVGVHGLPTSVEDKIRAEAEKQGVTLEFANALDKALSVFAATVDQLRQAMPSKRAQRCVDWKPATTT